MKSRSPVLLTLLSTLTFWGCALEEALPPPLPSEPSLKVETTAVAELGDGTKQVTDDAVGARVVLPSTLEVEKEGMTLENSYGFTVWSEAAEGDDSAHARRPLLRVALAYTLTPDQIEAEVQSRLTEFADLGLTRTEVTVGPSALPGVAVGPIPGSTPAHEIFVPVENRVYRLHAYGEALDAASRALLAGVELVAPTVALSSLPLVDANSDEALEAIGDEPLTDAELVDRADQALAVSDLPDGGEQALGEGCWRAPDRFFVQTQHGKYANRGRWNDRRAGWSKIGQPNFWGQFTHGNLGYGRCTHNYYTNDKFAIDYPLERGDAIFSPFRDGTVTFRGRNTTHRDYGIMVIIRAAGGKYWSLSGHLTSVKRGINRGKHVTNNTIIGFAGSTGGGRIAVGAVHLHQAFYRNPRVLGDGSPFAGQSLQVIYHRYVGTAAGTNGGVYRFSDRGAGGMKTQGDFISN